MNPLEKTVPARIVTVVKAGEECTHPKCPFFKLCGEPHRHAFDITLMELDAEYYADELRAKALSIHLWKDDERTPEPNR